MPSSATWCEDATLVQFSRDCANTSDPLVLQIIHDGPQVRRTLLCVRSDCIDRLLITDLLASQCPCSIRIAKIDTTGLRSGQSGLGALADQPRFQFGYSGHL